MKGLLGVLVLGMVVVLFWGCSSNGSSTPGEPDYSANITRQGETNYDISWQWNDADDGTYTVSDLCAWTYYDEYGDVTELAAPAMNDSGIVRFFKESSDTWASKGYVDVDSDTDGTDDNDVAVVKITGFQSNDGSHHTAARLLVFYLDHNDLSQYIAVYKGVDTTGSTTPWEYWDDDDNPWELGGKYDGTLAMDLDIAPDGQYMILAYYYNSGFRAAIWDTSPGEDTIFDFFSGAYPDGDDSDWISLIETNNGYGTHASVAMGAYGFGANDHSFAYAIPGRGYIELWQQGTGLSWTYQQGLGFTGPVDIACDGSEDHLFTWNEEAYNCKYYTLSSTAIPYNRDTFGTFGYTGTQGGINGFAWLTAGCVRLSGNDYIEVFIDSCTDHQVEAFANF